MKQYTVFISLIIAGMIILQTPVISVHTNTNPIILTVNTDGTGDFSSIQEAVDAASNGDHIIVSSGIYQENIHINKQITLKGEHKKTTIIDGNNHLDTIQITADQVNISDFTIQASGFSGRDAGIQIESNHTKIENTIIRNCTIGIFLHVANENQIINNEIYNCKDYGIHFNNANHNTVQGNILTQNRWGALITLSSANIIKSNIIHNNTVHGLWVLRHAVDNYIEENTISSHAGTGILIQLASYNNTIQGNIIEKNNNGGIEAGLFWSCDNTKIIENTIQHNNEYGVHIRASNYCLVYHNNFINNSIHASFFDSTHTQWDYNYWDESTSYPVLIKGRKNNIPWFNIDWHPVSSPYDLPLDQFMQYPHYKNIKREQKSTFPTSFNWNDVNGTNYLSPVKNQMPAPTCETYALCCSLETQVKLAVGAEYDCDLSEVHLFLYSGGTNQWGVDLNEPAEYLVTHGVPDEGCFPDPHRPHDFAFESINGWMNRSVKITEWGWVDNDVEAIKQALITHGPLVICQMTRKDLDLYSGGVYMPNINSPIQRGHVVAITGYDDEQQCWVIRNSAGEEWGEKGYFRIAYDAFDPFYSFIYPFYGGTGILYVDGVYGNLTPDVPRIYIETPDIFMTFINGQSIQTIFPYISAIQRGAPRILGPLPITVTTSNTEAVSFYIDDEFKYRDDTEPYEYIINESSGLHTLEVIAEGNNNISKDVRDIFIIG